MRLILLAATTFVSIVQTAHAQAPIDRGNNQSVAQRPRPDYDQLGVRLGSFEILPSVTLGAESNDNIYATQTATKDDTILTITPAISLASDWSQNALRLGFESTSAYYNDFDTENFTNLQANGDFRLDVSPDANIGVGGSYWNGVEARTSPDSPSTSVDPIEYTRTNGYVYGAYTFNRLRLTGRAEDTNYDYDNGTNVLGAVLDQQYRDHDEMRQTVRFEYAVSPSTALVLQGQTNQNQYDTPPPGSLVDRDSTGYSVQVGGNADLTNLMRGEITVGYFSQEWDHTNLSIDGLALNGNLEYFITRLTTITLTGKRAVEDSGLDYLAAVGRLSTHGSIRVDHELLRNVILTGAFGGGTDDYRGIDREDKLKEGELGVNYLMNRHASLGAHYYYTDVQSDGLDRDRDFTVNRFLVSVTLKL